MSPRVLACFLVVPSLACADESAFDATWKPFRPEGVSSGSVSRVVWTGEALYAVVHRGGSGFLYRVDLSTGTGVAANLDGHPAVWLTPALAWTGKEVLLWGMASKGPLGGLYDPTTDRWRPMASGPGVPDPVLPVTVWTGKEFVVWGGLKWRDTRAALHLLQPLLFSLDDVMIRILADMASDLARASLKGPSAAFDKLKEQADLIVKLLLPGYDGTPPDFESVKELVQTYLIEAAMCNSGARYEPETDTWKPISSNGAPSARAGHTMVWTGREVIVWGGMSHPLNLFNGFLGDGARYDPASDTWSPMSASHGPSGRAGHTMTWCDGKAIVWGGLDGYLSFVKGDFASTGAAYDPAGDAWTPLPTEGAPRGRDAHGATWTGRVLLVWGGDSVRDGCFGNGAAYDPAAGRWVVLPTEGAPSARGGAETVWTPHGMLVWGGHYLYRDGDDQRRRPVFDGGLLVPR